ncbi:MAG: carboxypeptidase regulatory-like domain-containing protein [Lewinellaceae bacterium]|nr:carboxypeptidase regulatory-like domain-containing protein [Lewinellaceae bacterium]
MKKTLILSVLIATFGLSSCDSVVFNKDKATAVVTGYVTDGFTGTRIQNADITLAGRISEQTQTGSNGEFRFSNLPEGEYTIEANAPGYTPNNQTVTLLADDVRNVDLTLYQGESNTAGNGCFQVSNENLNFGLTLNEMQVVVKNLKGIAQTLTMDAASYPWISVSPSLTQSIQPAGIIVWTITVDRAQIQSDVSAALPVNAASNSGNCSGFSLFVSVQK